MVPIGGLRIGPSPVDQAKDRMRLTVIAKVVRNKTIQPRDQGNITPCKKCMKNEKEKSKLIMKQDVEPFFVTNNVKHTLFQ